MTTEEIEKLVESNQEVIAKLNARNEALEQEVAEIKAHSKSIEGMKP
jgi:cell division protein FtsB